MRSVREYQTFHTSPDRYWYSESKQTWVTWRRSLDFVFAFRIRIRFRMVAEDGGFASPRQGKPSPCTSSEPVQLTFKYVSYCYAAKYRIKKRERSAKKSYASPRFHDLTPNRTGYPPGIEFDRLTTVSGAHQRYQVFIPTFLTSLHSPPSVVVQPNETF
jgi:hypothetical protein